MNDSISEIILKLNDLVIFPANASYVIRPNLTGFLSGIEAC